MKTFKEFVESSGKMSSQKERELAKISKLLPFKYSGWDIHPIVHARARAEERSSDIGADDWKKFMRNIYWYYKDSKTKTNTYKFHSRSLDISVIADRKDKQKTIMIVTVLPKGETYAKAGTKEVMVESLQESGSVAVGETHYEYTEVIILE